MSSKADEKPSDVKLSEDDARALPRSSGQPSRADTASEALISHLVDSLGYLRNQKAQFAEHRSTGMHTRGISSSVMSSSYACSDPRLQAFDRPPSSPCEVGDESHYEISPVETLSREHSNDSLAATIQQLSLSSTAAARSDRQHLWPNHNNDAPVSTGIPLSISAAIDKASMNTLGPSVGSSSSAMNGCPQLASSSSRKPEPGIFWQDGVLRPQNGIPGDCIQAYPAHGGYLGTLDMGSDAPSKRECASGIAVVAQQPPIQNQFVFDSINTAIPRAGAMSNATEQLNGSNANSSQQYYSGNTLNANALQSQYMQHMNAAAQLASVCGVWPPSVQALALAQLQYSLSQQQQRQNQLNSHTDECLVGIHGRYQPYCRQIITEDMNATALQLLHKVKTLQMSDPPTLSKMVGKRYFCSLKEVAKVVSSSKLILIAPDIRPSMTAHIKPVRLLELVLSAAESTGVPYVFVLSRRGIGQVFGREKSMSIVAVMNLEGVEAEYISLLDGAAKGQEAYQAAKVSPSALGSSSLPFNSGSSQSYRNPPNFDFGKPLGSQTHPHTHAAAIGLGLYGGMLPSTGSVAAKKP